MAAISGKLNFVHLTVPHNKKEAGMVALHENNYSFPGFYEALNKVTPLDGSDWNQEERGLFHVLTLDSRKDLHTVSKKMGKSMNNCLTYYLGKYKHSDGYRFTKEICVQEREDKKSRGNAEACAVCKEGGNLLICDTCEFGFHLDCVRPPLLNIPEGNWDCDDCLNMKLLEMRSTLLKETDVLQRDSDGKKTGNAHADTKIEDSIMKLTAEYGNNKEKCLGGVASDGGLKAAEVSTNKTTCTFKDEDNHEKEDVLSLKCHHEATRKLAETFRKFFQNSNII
uniref:PHD-type domain-containing protein n=1 Tax=Ditylum brightwellii TaxID=49249 RepID=A0A7S4VXZ5_9STRA